MRSIVAGSGRFEVMKGDPMATHDDYIRRLLSRGKVTLYGARLSLRVDGL